MMSLRRFMLCAIGGSFFVSQLTAAVEWHVIKINGRDFLSVDNVARFYGFPNPTINGKNIDLNNGKNEMQFHIESREMLLNGVRNWLSYPVFVHDGKIVVSRIDLAKTLEPQLRPRIANATHDSIFVSLHFNATDRDPIATGFEIYSLTPRGAPSTYEDGLTLASINIQNGTEADAASVELSSCIYHSLLGQIGE